MVFFRTNEPPGTIVVNTQERFLYLVQGNNRATLGVQRRCVGGEHVAAAGVVGAHRLVGAGGGRKTG